MSLFPQLADCKPVQQSGSYRAWKLKTAVTAPSDLIWYSRVDHHQPEQHRLLPFVEPSIALRRRFDARGRTESFEITYCPSAPDGSEYVPAPGEEQFAVRLNPENMETGLGLRMAEQSWESGMLHPFMPNFEGVLRLADAGMWQQSWAALVQAVLALGADREADRVSHASRILRNSAGLISGHEIAAAVGLSDRHMRRQINLRFGHSPRALSRRLRLTSAILEAEKSTKPNWADIAIGNGFSDQPHLIRECREILGDSPVQLHRMRRQMSVSFNQ